jgi:hypothetical protein
MDPAHQPRGVGGVVDVKRAGLEMRDDAVRPEADLLHLRRTRQARRDRLTLGGDRRRGVGPGGPGDEERLGDSPPDVVHDQIMPGPQQLPGDRRADIADPDKSDLHGAALPDGLPAVPGDRNLGEAPQSTAHRTLPAAKRGGEERYRRIRNSEIGRRDSQPSFSSSGFSDACSG